AAPHRHVARPVRGNVGAPIDKAGDLPGRQRIAIPLREQAQVGGRRGQQPRHRAVSLAFGSVTYGAMFEIKLSPTVDLSGFGGAGSQKDDSQGKKQVFMYGHHFFSSPAGVQTSAGGFARTSAKAWHACR